jgi:hypothetical protein
MIGNTERQTEKKLRITERQTEKNSKRFNVSVREKDKKN